VLLAPIWRPLKDLQKFKKFSFAKGFQYTTQALAKFKKSFLPGHPNVHHKKVPLKSGA